MFANQKLKMRGFASGIVLVSSNKVFNMLKLLQEPHAPNRAACRAHQV